MNRSLGPLATIFCTLHQDRERGCTKICELLSGTGAEVANEWKACPRLSPKERTRLCVVVVRIHLTEGVFQDFADFNGRILLFTHKSLTGIQCRDVCSCSRNKSIIALNATKRVILCVSPRARTTLGCWERERFVWGAARSRKLSAAAPEADWITSYQWRNVGHTVGVMYITSKWWLYFHSICNFY